MDDILQSRLPPPLFLWLITNWLSLQHHNIKFNVFSTFVRILFRLPKSSKNWVLHETKKFQLLDYARPDSWKTDITNDIQIFSGFYFFSCLGFCTGQVYWPCAVKREGTLTEKEWAILTVLTASLFCAEGGFFSSADHLKSAIRNCLGASSSPSSTKHCSCWQCSSNLSSSINLI